MDNSLVLRETAEGIATLTLNHPEKRNALSRAMLTALRQQLRDVAEDRAARVVILRAEGPAFCAGHDLREMVGAAEADQATLFALCTDVMETIRNLPKPVIASVHALATAAGCQLVATCDLVVAAESATFATPGVKIGLFCSTPAVALVRAVPPKKAMEMLLTGSSISATEAERLGLVNRVVAVDRLADETRKLALQIVAVSADTVARGKRCFYAQLPLDYPEAYAVAGEAMTSNAATADAQEGMKAFLEKRSPRWEN
jgi:enoyl-CoA hydratase/carnithine racemase